MVLWNLNDHKKQMNKDLPNIKTKLNIGDAICLLASQQYLPPTTIMRNHYVDVILWPKAGSLVKLTYGKHLQVQTN